MDHGTLTKPSSVILQSYRVRRQADSGIARHDYGRE